MPSNSNFRSGSSNGDFSFWVLSWINTHAHRERACIVNALGTSWASRKVAAQDAVVIHTARSGGGSGRDICWASILATRSAHLALSQPPAGCFKVQPGGNRTNKNELNNKGQQNLQVRWVRPIKSGISVPDSSLSRRAVSSLNPCILELKLLKSVG